MSIKEEICQHNLQNITKMTIFERLFIFEDILFKTK